jgi:hypothetical protein
MAKKRTQSKPAQDKPTAAIPQSGVKPGFTVKRQITMPTLTMKEASPAMILRFNSRMALSTYVDPDPKKQKEKPATVSDVTDMETGAIYKFLVPSVVEANLRRDYDAEVKISGEGKNAKITEDEGEHKYVGVAFQIQCLGKRPGKRYRDFSILEVEAEGA